MPRVPCCPKLFNVKLWMENWVPFDIMTVIPFPWTIYTPRIIHCINRTMFSGRPMVVCSTVSWLIDQGWHSASLYWFRTQSHMLGISWLIYLCRIDIHLYWTFQYFMQNYRIYMDVWRISYVLFVWTTLSIFLRWYNGDWGWVGGGGGVLNFDYGI